MTLILDHNSVEGIFGSAILPKGDRYELPRGTGQIRLVGLLALLTIGAVVAAVCRWMQFDLGFTLIFEALTAWLWWKTAQLREECLPDCQIDQTALRDEVRRWLRDRAVNTQDSTLQSDTNA